MDKADELRRTRAPVHLVLNGSSSLLVSRGLKETMADRFEKLHLGHWGARDLAATFGIAQAEAAELLVRPALLRQVFYSRMEAAPFW